MVHRPSASALAGMSTNAGSWYHFQSIGPESIFFKTQKCISALPFQKQWYNMFPFHSAINCIYVWFFQEWKLLEIRSLFIWNYQSGCLFLTSVLLQLLFVLSSGLDPTQIHQTAHNLLHLFLTVLEVWIFILLLKSSFYFLSQFGNWISVFLLLDLILSWKCA